MRLFIRPPAQFHKVLSYPTGRLLRPIPTSNLHWMKRNGLGHQSLAANLGSVSCLSNWGGGGGRPGGGNRAVQGMSALGAGAILLWGKGKYVLGALKLTKMASLGSMVLSVGTYSMFFGVPYAVGMVGLITVHEAGHALVMLQRGIPFSPMVFVPFVGATIAMNRRPRDAWEDALVAFGGPVLGSLGAGVCSIGGLAMDSQLLLALADFGYMINLFNMLPVGMMDGGRIAGALSPYAGVAGLGIGGSLALSGYVSNPIFILVLLAGGWETFQRFYNPGHLPPNYYRITPMQRTALTGGYFGLIAALFAAMEVNNSFKKSPEVLQLEKSWDMR